MIGYSFRDEPVNTILSEQLESATDPHVFVVNPHASTVVKNFPNYKRYKAYFHNVTIEFGKQGYEKEFFQAITQFLNGKSL